MRKALTDTGIKNQKPPRKGQVEIFDKVQHGMALRVTSNGAKSYVVRGRVKGHPTPLRITIATVGAIKLEDARTEAAAILAKFRAGIDPREELRTQKIVAERADQLLFEKVVENFIERHVKKNRTWRQTETLFQNQITPAWKGRLIHEVTTADVVTLLNKAEDRASVYRANRTLAALSKLFNWARAQSLLVTSPIVPGMAREGEKARERFLSFDEIKLVWDAADRIGHPFGPVFQFLLATGQRRGEVAAARWDGIDLEAKTWTLTAAETKADREHLVPLNPLAMAIIEAQPRINDPAQRKPIFAFTCTGSVPIVGFGRAKLVMDKLAGLKTDWRLHDLRRTVATHLGDALGFPPYIIGSVLNHAVQGVTEQHYSKGDKLFDRRNALLAWSRLLKLIIEGGATWQIVAKILAPITEADAARKREFRLMIQKEDAVWSDYLKALNAAKENVLPMRAKK